MAIEILLHSLESQAAIIFAQQFRCTACARMSTIGFVSYRPVARQGLGERSAVAPTLLPSIVGDLELEPVLDVGACAGDGHRPYHLDTLS